MKLSDMTIKEKTALLSEFMGIALDEWGVPVVVGSIDGFKPYFVGCDTFRVWGRMKKEAHTLRCEWAEDYGHIVEIYSTATQHDRRSEKRDPDIQTAMMDCVVAWILQKEGE